MCQGVLRTRKLHVLLNRPRSCLIAHFPQDNQSKRGTFQLQKLAEHALQKHILHLTLLSCILIATRAT